MRGSNRGALDKLLGLIDPLMRQIGRLSAAAQTSAAAASREAEAVAPALDSPAALAVSAALGAVTFGAVGPAVRGRSSFRT